MKVPTLPDWLGSITLFEVAALLAVILFLFALAAKAWPHLTGLVQLTEDLKKLPAALETLEELRQDVAHTKEQVQNSHKTNLRDDIDALHETARDTAQTVKENTSKIDSIVSDIASLRATDDRQWEAIIKTNHPHN